MSTYKSFALIGAGLVGKSIIEAFKDKENVSLVVLTRSSSNTSLELPPSVKLEQADYEDSASVAAIFKKHGVEVVISTVTTFAIGSQNKLADAAKQAGTVKLFVPSEFGLPTLRLAGNPKEEFANYLQSIGLPSLRIFTGVFAEFVPWLASLSINGKVHVLGKGDTPFSSTAIVDIGGFVAHVLTTLPPSELNDKIFRIEGDRLTLNQVAKLHKTETQELDLTTEPTDPLDAFKRVAVGWTEEGGGSTGWDWVAKKELESGWSANRFWPGHTWKTVKETLKL